MRSRARWLASLLYPLSQAIIVSFLLYMFAAGGLPAWTYLAACAMSILCAVSDWFLFKGLRSAEDKELAEARVHLLEEQVDAQEAYGRALERQRQEAQGVRRVIADELRHAQELLDSAGGDAALERATQAVSRMDGGRRFCAHQVVDALLMLKARACDQAGIRFDVQVELPPDAFLPSVDLGAVFSNALDNAINACRDVPEGERFVSVRAHVAHGLFVLKVANACDPDAEAGRGSGSPHRAAEDSRREGGNDPGMEPKGKAPRRGTGLSEHGWGLLIMEDVAKRHDGELTIEQQGGICTTVIVMRSSGLLVEPSGNASL